MYELTKKADIIISACGMPDIIKKEHVKEGVILIDTGINQVPRK